MSKDITNFNSIVAEQPYEKLLIIGAGFMGSSLANGILKSNIPLNITVSDLDENRLNCIKQSLNVNTTFDNKKATAESDIIILAVKPAIVPDVLNEIKDFCTEKKIIISIAAGVTIATIEELIPKSPVVRVMPNICAQIQEGAVAYALGSKPFSENTKATIANILSSVGMAIMVKENQLDAVTGLSGSGPAYIFMAIEALSDGGVLAGLPRDISTKLAAQTVYGSAKMVLETGLHPGYLKDMVTSPAGTTIEGVAELEEKGVRSAYIKAVTAAYKKSKKLAEK